MTINQEPATMTVDEVLAQIDLNMTAVDNGDVTAAKALVPLWAALNKHLSRSGEFPSLWTATIDNALDTPPADDDGGFLFGETTPAVVEAILITSGKRATYGDLAATPSIDMAPTADPAPGATVFERTRGTQKLRQVRPLTLSEPSRLGRRGQHNLDSPITSIEAINTADVHLHFMIFRELHKVGQRGYIDDELEQVLDRVHQGLSSARREMTLLDYVQELRGADGKVVRRPTRSGKSAKVRVLTDVARRRVLLGKEPWFTS